MKVVTHIRWAGILLLLALASCTGTPRPGGNGEGIVGLTANFDNARIRCEHQGEAEHNSHQVLCRVVIMTPKGNEVVAESIEANTSLTWAAPVQTSGVPVDSVDCTVEESHLHQNCTVKLSPGTDAKLDFSLDITKAAKKRRETVEVHLPYAVRSFGSLPQMAQYQPLQSTALQATGQPTALGVQTPYLAPEGAMVGPMFRFCVQGDRLFYFAGQQVFVQDTKGTRVYAGSGDVRAFTEFSHRLRIAFKANRYLPAPLLCEADAIVVADRGRVLRISDDGPVVRLAGHPTETEAFNYPEDKAVALETTLPNVLALLPARDGSLYLALDSAIYRLDSQGRLNHILGDRIYSHSNTPTDSGSGPIEDADLWGVVSMALDASGNLLAMDGGHQRVLRVDGEGRFSTLVSAAELEAGGVYNPGSSLNQGLRSMAPGSDGTLYLSTPGWIYALGTDRTLRRVAGTMARAYTKQVCRTTFSDSHIVDKPALDSKLADVTQVQILPSGELAFVESLGCRILRVDREGKLRAVARTRSPLNSDSFTDSPDTSVFPPIRGMAMLPDGGIHFTHAKDHLIYHISADGKSLSPQDYNGRQTVMFLNGHLHVAHAPDGYTYFMERDSGLRTLRRVGEDETVEMLTSPYTHHYSNTIEDMVAGPDSTIYFLGDDRIFKLDEEWNAVAITAPARPNHTPFSGNGNAATSVSLMRPQGLAVSHSGDIFVTDPNTHYSSPHDVYRIDAVTGTIHRIAGGGTVTEWTDGADALGLELPPLGKLDVDRLGNVYVVENRSRILKLQPTEQGDGGVAYKVSTFLKAESKLDCSGRVATSGRTERRSARQAVNQALSTLCFGLVGNFQVVDSCHLPNGEMKYAFSQEFGELGTIVRVSRPCPSE